MTHSEGKHTTQLHSYSFAERFKVSQLTSYAEAKELVRVSSKTMKLKLDAHQRVYLYDFGTVVFCGVPIEEHKKLFENVISRLSAQGGARHEARNATLADVVEDEAFSIVWGGSTTQVTFDCVEAPEYSEELLDLVCHVIARSSALDVIESEVKKVIAQSEELSADIRRLNLFFTQRKRVVNFLSKSLEVRHRVINHLALLDEPGIAWQDETLADIYAKLFDNFDLQERFDAVEHLLKLAAEVSSVVLELSHASRSEILDWLIVLLITVEILGAFF
jgi:required for meiotic nuclear division protein 1